MPRQQQSSDTMIPGADEFASWSTDLRVALVVLSSLAIVAVGAVLLVRLVGL